MGHIQFLGVTIENYLKECHKSYTINFLIAQGHSILVIFNQYAARGEGERESGRGGRGGGEGGGGRRCCSTHLCILWLIFECALTRPTTLAYGDNALTN